MFTLRICSFLLLAVLISGCAGVHMQEVHVIPEVSLNSSFEKAPEQPILISIIDHDTVKREGDFAPILSNSIDQVFPNAYKIVPPTASMVAGSVSMRIHVRRLGGFFNQTGVSVLQRSGYTGPVSGNADGWQKVILASKSQDPVISGTVGGRYGIRHGWSGIAFLDIEVHDLRFDSPRIFTVSIAAERSTPNRGGYFSAKINFGRAWENVEPRLARFLNAAVTKVTDEQSQQVAPPKPKKSGSSTTI